VREAKQALVDLLTPVSKAWSTDLGCEIASLGVQIHGGMGFIEETGAAQYYRDARIAPIYEGTNGIQAIDLVMRKLPLLGGGAVRALLDEMRAITAELPEDDAQFDTIGDSLSEGIAALADGTEWMLAIAAKDPNRASGGAVPYLRLFGNVAGGWLLARQALAAARFIAAGDQDPFYANKIATARFYAEQVLSQAEGLLTAATLGADMLAAIPDAALAVA
jgi:alkylation response protein AidB-like acyl-CoA dehydrogenase